MKKIFNKIINFIKGLVSYIKEKCKCPQYKAGNNITIKDDVISTSATSDTAVGNGEMNNLLDKIFH